MACKGGPRQRHHRGDCVELADTQRAGPLPRRPAESRFYLRLAGPSASSPPTPRPTIRAFGLAQGQVTVEASSPATGCTCKPVRDLLVDYLKERQPALDYASLDSGSHGPWPACSGPGSRPCHRAFDTLQLPPEVARAWKEDLLTIKRAAHRPRREQDRRHPDADQRQGRADPRPGALPRHRPVGHGGARALGAVGGPEPGQRRRDQPGQERRRRKARMGQRTRERLPVLPVPRPAPPQTSKNAAARRLQAAINGTARRDHSRTRADAAPGRCPPGQRAARVGRRHRHRQAPQPVV